MPAPQGRTVVTLDADFHALLMVNRQTSPSVIRFRQEGLKGEDLAAILETVSSAVSADLERGALVTATARSIRVHRLKERLAEE
jgi:predicted nuclease of predicted toxin-antitoxin system